MLENTLSSTHTRLSLAGKWSLELAGARGKVMVPGAWEAQGWPLAAVGPAVYRRTVDIPAWSQDARIYLEFGAVSYFTEVIVNGQPVGAHEGMWTPFAVDISAAARLGAANEIELRVTKAGRDGDAYPYHDVLAGFIPYVADTFGGPWQDICLTAHTAPAWAQVYIAPDWQTGTVQVKGAVVGGHEGLTVHAEVRDKRGSVVAQAKDLLRAEADTAALTLTVPDHEAWAPGAPTRYELSLALYREDTLVALAAPRFFGFRQLTAQGDQLLLNGAPVHLRGVLSWGWNPATLAPVLSDDEVRALFQRAREHGFNLVKLCLFVPPPRFYEIADEEGMLLWLELPLWLPRMSEHLRRQASREYSEILARDHYHPAIVIYSLGCELGADMADADLLANLDRIVRGAACGALVCDNSGSGEAYRGLTFDFADFSDYHFYSDLHYFNPLLDHFQRDWRPPRPLIFGEFCDSDDYRAADCLTDDGVRPWWRDVYGVEGGPERWAYSEQEQRMAANRLPFTDAQLVHISRSESLLIRKFILEQTRLRRSIGGYVITGLRDTPISTSGIFDDRDQPKFDAAAFRAFNADAVLLLERGRTRAWRSGGDRPAPLDLFNHWAGDSVDLRVVLAHTGLAQAEGDLTWRLAGPDSAQPALTGAQRVRLPQASPVEIARLAFTLPALRTAQQWTLTVELAGVCRSSWPLWVYPPAADWPHDLMLHDPGGALDDISALPFDPRGTGVLVSTALTPDVQAFVHGGGRAVLLAQPHAGLPTQAVPFWRESIKLLYPHALLAQFPHQGYADLQFYHLATDYAFDMRRFNQHLAGLVTAQPIIQRLDARLFTLLEYMVEARVGQGHLLATTLRLAGGAGDQARGLRASPAGHFLLAQMIAHVQRA